MTEIYLITEYLITKSSPIINYILQYKIFKAVYPYNIKVQFLLRKQSSNNSLIRFISKLVLAHLAYWDLEPLSAFFPSKERTIDSLSFG